MKNLKIRSKLLLTFMLVIILFCGTVAIAIAGLQENEDKYSEFYNVEYQITNKVMSMRRGLQIIVKDLSFLTIEKDASRRNSYLSDLQKELNSLSENATWLMANFTGDQELLNLFAAEIQEAIALQETIISTTETDMVNAQDMLLDEYQPLVEEAVNSLIQISSVAEQSAETNYLSTVDMQENLVILQLAMAGIALFITIALSTYLTRSITKPLRELEKSAGQIVEGNFDISIAYESKDELGSLAKSFKNMTLILETVVVDASRLLSEMANGNFDVRTNAEERYVGHFQNLLLSIRKLNKDLSITLGQINQSADQVASGSGQVSNGAQALAQGATEQAASVEELASTIANISHQVKNTADNALEAKTQSGTAGNEAEICNDQMREMITAMEEIARSSNEISKIIKTIEDIAFQTNILALNAAVEAARAGTAGKGFAVVADEVRNLASKSDQAAKATTDLIDGSIAAVKEGVEVVERVTESLQKTIHLTTAAVAQMNSVTEAVETQTNAITQVTVGIDQISAVVQTNSATSQECAAASEELSSQAAIMHQLMSEFKVRRGSGSAFKSSFSSAPVSAPAPVSSYSAPVEDSFDDTSYSAPSSKSNPFNDKY